MGFPSANYVHFTGPVSSTIHAGTGGYLQSVTVNTAGGASAKVIIYDNSTASGAQIASIDVSTYIGTYSYNLSARKGLSVSITGSNTDVTIVWSASA